MEVGVDVWIKDTHGDQSWIPAVVHSKEYTTGTSGKLKIAFLDEFNEIIEIIVDDEADDTDDVKLRNNPTEIDVDNLISLPYLHEPAILHCLEQRYALSDIYTYTGPILIAMNPFKKVPLYTDQILEVYYNEGLLRAQGIESGTHLPPHVYAIADAAYRDMMRVILAGYHHHHTTNTNNSGSSSSSSSSSRGGGGGAQSANQSILISGESGAGKTESTKIVLRYLTTVGNNNNSSNNGATTAAGNHMAVEEGSVMDKVLQSNPILEAFGNARTLRNDNSSRFGKFIELSFNRRGHLIGGVIRTYLLEKVRLPSQQRGERNFHIFYQLAAGASAEQRSRWGLLPATTTPSTAAEVLEQFEYTVKGGIFELQSMDDRQEFRDLQHALSTLNFAAADQETLLDVTAALLHLGQVQFCPVFDAEGEGSAVAGDADSQSSLALCARLLGLQVAHITRTLTVRTITAREESYEKKLTPQQASDARDAVAKAIYGRLFDWIVRTINLSIEVDTSLVRSSIGVLDIFGFECFAHNSFEQLCINYTNEALQQQFNQYIFKMEQREYQKEQIEWSFVEFPDNQDCLDLIEHKVNGILAMIDDECRLPKASDEKLAARMYKAYEGGSSSNSSSAAGSNKLSSSSSATAAVGVPSSQQRFSASKTEKRDFQFCIQHYAGAVVYSTLTFVEKNKDELPKEATSLLVGSTLPLLKALFTGGTTTTLPAAAATTASSMNTTGRSISTAATGVAGTGVGKGKSASSSSSASVGAQFKEQLSTLMASIYATTPHYIRCLKPNDANVSDNFNRLRITEQLRYGGVLEAVRVARSGFPVRLSHFDFYARYRPLANPFFEGTKTLPAFCYRDDKNSSSSSSSSGGISSSSSSSNCNSASAMKQLCDQLITALWDETLPPSYSSELEQEPEEQDQDQEEENDDKNEDRNRNQRRAVGAAGASTAAGTSQKRKSRIADLSLWQSKSTVARQSVQLGITKVFLRKAAHDVLESRRSRRLASAARKIQSLFRCRQLRAWFLGLVLATRLLQRMTRGTSARRTARQLRHQRAALRVQRQFRRYVQQWRYQTLLRGVLVLQCVLRGLQSKRAVASIRCTVHALRLQCWMRAWLRRRRWGRFRGAVVVLQSRQRKARAKALLRSLRAAARDVGRLQQSNDALKQEIAALQSQAAEERERVRAEVEKSLQNQAALAQLEELELLKAELANAYERLKIEEALHREAQAQLAQAEEALKVQGEALRETELRLYQSSKREHGATSPSSTISNSSSYQQQQHPPPPSFHAAAAPIGEGQGEEASSQHSSSAASQNSHSLGRTRRRSRSDSHSSTGISVSAHVVPVVGATTSSNSSVGVSGVSSRRQSRNNSINNSNSNRNSGSLPPSRSGSMHESRRSSRRASFGHAAGITMAAADSNTSNHQQQQTVAILRTALEQETLAREVLEEEASRLRLICMDQKVTIDAQKAQLQQHRSTATSTATNSAATAGGTAVSATAPLSPLSTGSSSVAPNPRSRNSQQRNPPPPTAAAAAHVLKTPAHRRGSHVVPEQVQVSAMLDLVNGTTGAGAGADGGGGGGGGGGIVQHWSQTWDAEEEEEDDEELGRSKGQTSYPAGAGAASNGKDRGGENKEAEEGEDVLVSVASVVHAVSPDVPSHTNPLLARNKQKKAQQAAATYTAATAAATVTRLADPKEMLAAVGAFEKNIEAYRQRFRSGIKARLWEGMKISNAEVILKLDASGRLLTFDSYQAKRGFAFFQTRVDVSPIGLSEIAECLAGAEVNAAEASDQSLLLTIVARSSSGSGSGGGSRILALMLNTRDVRNSVMSGLRALSADAQFAPATKAAQLLVNGGTSASSSTSPMKNSQSSSGSSSSSSMTTVAAGGGGSTDGRQRSTRRLSVREVVLEEKMARGSSSSSSSINTHPNRSPSPAAAVNNAQQQQQQQQALEEMQQVLLGEQKKNGNMTMQIVLMTNELSDRDEQIAMLKKKEEHYEQALLERDNMYKQDAMVRMQLGKKLEQVLMDKEEAYEQLEALKEQLEGIRAGL